MSYGLRPTRSAVPRPIGPTQDDEGRLLEHLALVVPGRAAVPPAAGAPLTTSSSVPGSASAVVPTQTSAARSSVPATVGAWTTAWPLPRPMSRASSRWRYRSPSHAAWPSSPPHGPPAGHHPWRVEQATQLEAAGRPDGRPPAAAATVPAVDSGEGRRLRPVHVPLPGGAEPSSVSIEGAERRTGPLGRALDQAGGHTVPSRDRWFRPPQRRARPPRDPAAIASRARHRRRGWWACRSGRCGWRRR